MAPRFRQLLYQTYAAQCGAEAFVGFPKGRLELRLRLRDALCEEIEKTTGLASRIDVEGPYDDVDVHVKFFDAEDADVVNGFYSKPWPGFFAWLFRTRDYRDYKAEHHSVERLIKIDVSTSHDWPCVAVTSSIHTRESIAQLIEKVAHDLDTSIVRSKLPYPMVAILTSNRSFGDKQHDA